MAKTLMERVTEQLPTPHTTGEYELIHGIVSEFDMRIVGRRENEEPDTVPRNPNAAWRFGVAAARQIILDILHGIEKEPSDN